MARDHNIAPVRELRDDLARDGLIEGVATYEYALRSDFKARILHRERAIIVVLRRRGAGDEEPSIDEAELADVQDEEIEVYDFERDAAHAEPEQIPAGVPQP